MSSKPARGLCVICSRRYPISKEGKLYAHNRFGGDYRCPGSYDTPPPESVTYPAEEPTIEVLPMPWYQRYYFHLVLAAGMAAAFGLGWGVGAGVAGGWHW